ncbi:MAG TPA: D-alanyl-D-alanine carboxypeptidase/D-alanyl-D-alanine-endopeptidase [Polyangia bacterium]|nr:D-alanyl-D-alanine carboxypeptidase/D-alanyl-D-alanine-endopeptidase [Polyangia bacterium]
MKAGRHLIGGVALLALSSPGVASTSRGSSKDAAASDHHHHHAPVDNAPEPAPDDRDRDRIVRMQAALRDIVRNGILGRMRVGVKVVEARTGRLFYSQRDGTLMDPASNQKVLATTTALMRLGADWRFRTELTGPAPTTDGTIVGDVYLRGNGDPTFRSGDLDAMAAALARRGVRTIAGAVVADPRRIGADEPIVDGESAEDDGKPPIDATENTPPGELSPRVPLVVNHGLMLIRVRPGVEPGAPAEVTTTPADPSFVIHNGAVTKAKRRSHVTVRLSINGSRIQIDVEGRVSAERGGIVFRRRVPHQALYAAALMRASLQAAGVTVRDDARVAPTPPQRSGHVAPLLAVHESAPLGILLRKINKDSDNDYAERVLEAAGAEVYGGSPTGEKGVRLLREVIGELGLPPGSYVPKNGSGLGHANRITADAMSALLRTLYLDPRVGPEILQSLSVGGVDGTTRNRFKGTIAAERVRAKTGTLRGKSCLSGLVGDGSDVLAFSILVEGIRGRRLAEVRGAQVGCVNAMMRYVVEAADGARPVDIARAGSTTDLETGGASEGEEEVATTQPPPGTAAQSHEDPIDAFLRKQRDATAAPAAPPAAPTPPALRIPPRGVW